MPTIAEQLQELINQKNTLAENLTTKGVPSSNTEKLNTLVPKVLQIDSGGIDTSDATATANKILSGETAYAKGSKITGNIPSKSSETYIPGRNDQTISSGQYLSGTQTIKGDTDLIPSNIKKDVDVFGVVGTYFGMDTSDATALDTDIVIGKTAYVNNAKVTGTVNMFGFYDYPARSYDQTVAGPKFLEAGKTLTFKAVEINPEDIAFNKKVYDKDGTFTKTSSTETAADSGDVISGKTFFVNGQKIIGTVPSVNGATIMPTTTDQVTQDDVYLNTPYTVKGDINLVPGNIIRGVTIFGVEGVNDGGTDTSDATATAGQILTGATAYVKGVKLTGTMPSKSAQTYIPTTTDQVISNNQYLSGTQTIKGDADLIPSNIKNGVDLFGVVGTLTGADDLDEATIIPSDIKYGKIAYGNDGEKITGSAYTVIDPIVITPGVLPTNLQSGFYNGISIDGDADLIPGNIKKDVEIFGVVGTYEGSSPMEKQIVLDCELDESQNSIVSRYGDIIKVINNSVHSNLSSYVYNAISAIDYSTSGGLLSGITYKTNNTGVNGMYFLIPISFTSSTILVSGIGYVSSWINPYININFIQADSVDELPTKIANSDFVYSKQIQVSPLTNSSVSGGIKKSFYELNNISLGEYYIYLEIPATGGNEAILNNITIMTM